MAEWEGFEKLGRLGVGATGTVWLARQLSVGRAVALKEPAAPEIAGDVVACERLRRAAQLLARLDDPNCVAVYSFLELATVVSAATVVVAGVSVGLGADEGSSSPAASDLSGLPTTVRTPMEGLDWRGFVIRPSSSISRNTRRPTAWSTV